MADSHHSPPESANHSEHRSHEEDRRIEDTGPPKGWKERRKHVERRIPHPEEIEMSEAEWELYFTEKKAKGTVAHEAAGDIFDAAARAKGR
jgi:hypothetical protein